MISIRRQLTRELIGAFLVLLGVALAALYLANRMEIIEQFDQTLLAKALSISSLSTQKDGKIQVDVSDAVFRSFTRKHPHDFFEIHDANGVVVARSESLDGADLPWPERTTTRPRTWDMKLPDGRAGRALSGIFNIGPDTSAPSDNAPRLYLEVASERGEMDEALAELLAVGVVAGLLLAGVTWWLVPKVLRRGLRPLEKLGEQTARIDANSLTTRLSANDLPAELQPIARRLNELLARLEISFERERRFSADLAHELRTPLAELRSLAECALKWPETRDRATDEETLSIATQMQTLVTRLLALVRGEQPLVHSLEGVDLQALTQEAWHSFSARAAERRLQISLEAPPVSALADPALLRAILTNLFENAVDYTPAGGAVAICVESKPDTVTLRIRNSSDGLTAEDVTKMFDRFWRKEEARSGGNHFGLGLSLAKMFAHAMDWTLSAQLDEQRRLEFTLSGPAAKTA